LPTQSGEEAIDTGSELLRGVNEDPVAGVPHQDELGIGKAGVDALPIIGRVGSESPWSTSVGTRVDFRA